MPETTSTRVDTNNQYNWTEITSTFEDGELISELTTFDNGNTQYVTFSNGVQSSVTETDNADLFSWTERTTGYFTDLGDTVSNIETLYDNGVESSENFNRDGSPRHTTIDDVLNVADWRRLFVIYDEYGDGARDRESTIFDDGVTSESYYNIRGFSPRYRYLTREYDDGNTYDWAYRTLRYDYANRLNGASISDDDGGSASFGFTYGDILFPAPYLSSLTVTIKDENDSAVWERTTISYDEETGDITSRVTTNNLGETIEELVDPNDPSTTITLTAAEQAAYDRLMTYISSADPELAREQIADDVFMGTEPVAEEEPLETIVETDDDAAFDWSEIRTSYDTSDEIVLRETVYDDGGTKVETFVEGTRASAGQNDLGDSHKWDTVETIYDADGKPDSRTTTYDDGSLKQELYDAGKRVSISQQDLGDTNKWDTIETLYDANGKAEIRTTLYDDGGIKEEFYDAGKRVSISQRDLADANKWDTIETLYDANGKAEIRTTLYDDGGIKEEFYDAGKRVSISQQDLGDTNKWDTIETLYDANGKAETRTTVYDNSDLTVLLYDNGKPDVTLQFDGDDSNDWLLKVTDRQSDGSASIITTYDAYEDIPQEYQDYFSMDDLTFLL